MSVGFGLSPCPNPTGGVGNGTGRTQAQAQRWYQLYESGASDCVTPSTEPERVRPDGNQKLRR
eukprot:11184632-Lingulodinium_polyedra.AAC.1